MLPAKVIAKLVKDQNNTFILLNELHCLQRNGLLQEVYLQLYYLPSPYI